MDVWNSEYKSHQGNVGLGQAIAYYTMRGIPVLLPLNDTQKYDIVIDNNGLKRVSIKTTQSKEPSGNFRVELKNSGGGSKGSKIPNFANTTCDILFIYTKAEEIYEIPSQIINSKSAIVLNESKYGQYRKQYGEL